ncbi:MAG: NUDIX domain-containing protein [Candidatus Pacebacteria bacterium]|nr:NUDIX domain-containing protein [Candidatus Paceibacterota bacterium]
MDIKKKIIKKAGGIILNNDKSKIAIIYRANTNDWSFPKGHIENSETPLGACIREVKEETGLDVELLKELPDLNYEDKKGNIVNLTIYLVQSKKNNLTLENPKDILKWVDINKVENILSYKNLKEYYKKILFIINN